MLAFSPRVLVCGMLSCANNEIDVALFCINNLQLSHHMRAIVKSAALSSYTICILFVLKSGTTRRVHQHRGAVVSDL